MRRAEGYISSRAGKRLEKIETEIHFQHGRYVENEMINIFPERRYQEVLGFGGAFTEASAYNYSRLDDEKKRKVIKAFFIKRRAWGITSAGPTSIPVIFRWSSIHISKKTILS